MDKVSIQTVYKVVALGTLVEDEAMTTFGKLNVLTYEDILLSIDMKTVAQKVTFNLVNTCYSKEFPELNCKFT